MLMSQRYTAVPIGEILVIMEDTRLTIMEPQLLKTVKSGVKSIAR